MEEHERLREEGLNLIASENYLSPRVRKALASDLAGRYHTEWYGGSSRVQEIIEATEDLARKLFKVKHAIVTPLSGNLCDLTVLFAFTEPNDKVAMVPFSAGGYPLGVEKFHRKHIPLPMHDNSFDIDVKAAIKLITDEPIRLTILGSSYIPFPHPVREISKAAKKSGDFTCCVYDGSHTLGLIACGEFQNPLGEGAEVLFGSTHKTFYGPQGGIILTNSSEHAQVLRSYLDIDLEKGIGLVDNPHPNRIAALGIAVEEMLQDPDYGKGVIGNAKVLARTLDEKGVPVRFKERDYTRSHQVFLDIDSKRAAQFCHQLERIGVFIDEGGRIGVGEVTHRGMDGSTMREIARLISEAYFEGAREELRTRVRDLIGSYGTV